MIPIHFTICCGEVAARNFHTTCAERRKNKKDELVQRKDGTSLFRYNYLGYKAPIKVLLTAEGSKKYSPYLISIRSSMLIVGYKKKLATVVQF